MRVRNFFPTPQRGGARLNALHPGSQAQETSKKSSIYLSIRLVLLHPSIDLFLVALIRVYPSMEQHKSQQCGPRRSKSTKNPSQIHQKPSHNPPSKKDASKTHSKSVLNTICSIVYRFLESPGPPKIEAKPPNSEQMRSKFDAEKKITPYFLDIS